MFLVFFSKFKNNTHLKELGVFFLKSFWEGNPLVGSAVNFVSVNEEEGATH
ncbi:predicted protein [Sclerotinia sclerotiorum 1980 UF-70]|uniref:Uncharacterized protein n=1 Tax=Sclerotinia sclerotiorum (strain ATCC 18683 / 1980 / Ss-1) TaxID=665079 RepID=A7EKN9_SCLS1|nr:predicted protein [Sclerotinia sclerotiorum 1980 UF-70]EDO03405.1 predicted protein [Sclerotinia sclerotiorum 1980 UF-70]